MRCCLLSLQPVPSAADVPWHRGSVTSSPSRRYPVAPSAAAAPAYDVNTLSRKSLDHRRKFTVGFVTDLYLIEDFGKCHRSVVMSGECTKDQSRRFVEEDGYSTFSDWTGLWINEAGRLTQVFIMWPTMLWSMAPTSPDLTSPEWQWLLVTVS